jgi:hypothetical protein
MKTVVLSAPKDWASYLIYDDASGLDDNEIAACDAWLKAEFSRQSHYCVDSVEVGFMRYHDAGRFYPLAADCAEYTFII